MERELVTRSGIEFEAIQAGPVVGVDLGRMLSGILRLAWGTLQAWGSVSKWKPDALFVTGGFTAIPVALVCWLKRIPILVYLPDIEPGSAVKFVAKFASVVAVTSPDSREYFPNRKVVVTGYPVRPEVAAARRPEAVTHFGLVEDRPTVLVFGGSRGARSINLALLDALDDLLTDLQIIHVSGELDWLVVSDRAASLPESKRRYYHAFPYLHDDMGLAFASAEVVVARAGASTLGEIPMFGLSAILVPYPYAWRYQKVNADYLAARGVAVRLNDEDLKMRLTATLRDLLGNPDRLKTMRAAARALAVPDAANRIATELLGLMAAPNSVQAGGGPRS
jgi:UDP-N-acetylglucosamine--N-acetylmuramyl-(pentapeptide) pyrophosphoryl-undecaprenol N-acetylglucosamine transferase